MIDQVDELDTSNIGLTASEMMEVIARHYPDAQIEDVAIVVALRHTSGASSIETYSSNPRQWVNEGLFRHAADVVRNGIFPK